MMKRSSLVTAALPRGNYTRFPILLFGHSFTFQTKQFKSKNYPTPTDRNFLRQDETGMFSANPWAEIILAGRFDNLYSRHSSL
jgi:hypothetical protein